MKINNMLINEFYTILFILVFPLLHAIIYKTKKYFQQISYYLHAIVNITMTNDI